MDCRDADRLIEAFVDGHLSPETGQEVENHLAACSACRGKHELAWQIASSLRTLPVQRCPERVLARTMTQIRSEDTGWIARLFHLVTGMRSLSPARLGLVTAAVVLLVLALSVFPPTSWFKKSKPAYSQEEIQRAERTIALAFGYVDHATGLAQDVLRKEHVPDRVLKPLWKSVGFIPSHKRKGDKL